MIKLEENQRVYTIKSGDKWYTCISGENGLVSYLDCPYLSVENGETTVNMKAFKDDYEAIKNFDIEDEAMHVRNADDFGRLVGKIMNLQHKEFTMSAFKDFATRSSLPENFKKGATACCNTATQLLDMNESVFRDIATKAVPKNWAYAMFHESSWSAYSYYVAQHKVACGETTRSAGEIGRTLSDDKEADRSAKQRDHMAEDVNQKRFLDLQTKIDIIEHRNVKDN